MLIQPHQAQWKNDFNNLQSILSSVLPSTNVSIEHVGSTSVKDLAAKPIIDIDIAYSSPISFEIVKNALENLGYYHNGNQGIEGREVFKRHSTVSKHPILDQISHHLYACHIDNSEFQRHIFFRNHLRNNAQARLDYEKLKYQIAKQAHQDRKMYAQMKEKMAKSFIENILSTMH